MRIVFISDVHANHIGLRTVLKNIGQVDKIFCAGDITGYFPFPNEVIKLLKEYNVICVKGNHDKYLLDGRAPQDANQHVKDSVKFTKKIISDESLDFLKNLPEKIELTIDDKKVFICHGSPWNLLEERIYPDYPNFERFEQVPADLVVLGHTHYPFIKKVGDKTIINPGSCGQPRDYNKLSYALWNLHNNEFKIERIDWDIDQFKKEAQNNGTNPELFGVFNRQQQ